MKKLYITLLILSSAITSIWAQTPFAEWHNFYYYNANKVTVYTGQNSDTMYCAIVCRNGKFQTMKSSAAGSLTAQALTDGVFDAGDSITWRVVKGAPLGTKPRVRMINLKTGEYLKQGTLKGALSAYVAPYFDTVPDGELNFALQYQSFIGYYIVGKGNTQFFNDVSGAINVKNTSAVQGWYFHARKGPLPKTPIITPGISLTTQESAFYAGGKATFKAKLTKGANELKGKTLLYVGENLIDTLQLDQNGEVTKEYNNLVYGQNIFTLVYTGDDYYGTEYVRDTLNVGASLNAIKTTLTMTAPVSSELYKDVLLNFNVKTVNNEIVGLGDVLVYVNNRLKNRCTVDLFGNTSLNFPNLLPGSTHIKAVYVGDKIELLDSDSAKSIIEITPSTSNVSPYPVYFDLSSQFEITDWARKNLTTTMTHKYTRAFRTDSLPGITITDDTLSTFKIKNIAIGTSYSKLADAFNHADYVAVPLGSSRPTSVKIKTPWLNAGAYNVFISHRKSGDAKMNISAVALDENELYWPNEEMTGRWFKSSLVANNYRKWNAKGYDIGLNMNYLGSVSTDNSGVHTLQIDVLPENGGDIMMDMIQFIPIDQDSLSINLSAAESMAKIYYPMFSFTGFTYQSGYNVAEVVPTFADNSSLALPYQVADSSNWGTQYPFTVTGMDVDTVMIGSDPVYANYATVYKADDKWTRVASGSAVDGKFVGELPQGRYYYETIFFTDLSDGAYDYRTLVKTGYFELPLTGTNKINKSSIKVYSFDQKLCVNGIASGAKIIVTDITGKVLINITSNTDRFTTPMQQGIYIVKVVSGETMNAKVIVR